MDDDTLYFEDIDVGLTRDCGSVVVEREEMLEFAERYDPQPIHTDPEAASETMFGGLIASGWLTAALTARLLVTGYMNDTASLGGRGMDDLRWHTPVSPGDELSVTVEVLDRRPSETYPGMGHVESEVVTTNDRDQRVLSMVGLGLVERRETDA